MHIREVLHLIAWVAWAGGPLLIIEYAPLGDHLYVLNFSVYSTEELSSCLFNSIEERNIIIQPSTMIDIAHPMPVIDPRLPAQYSPPARLDAVSDSDTFCPLLEMPAAALAMSMDAFSSFSVVSSMLFVRRPSSSLVLHALCSYALSTSVPFVRMHWRQRLPLFHCGTAAQNWNTV